MSKPNAKPAMYSTAASTPIGNPSRLVTAAATMMPVASPAMQWIAEPTDCFQSGAMTFSCAPGAGSRQENQYTVKATGPV